MSVIHTFDIKVCRKTSLGFNQSQPVYWQFLILKYQKDQDHSPVFIWFSPVWSPVFYWSLRLDLETLMRCMGSHAQYKGAQDCKNC